MRGFILWGRVVYQGVRRAGGFAAVLVVAVSGYGATANEGPAVALEAGHAWVIFGADTVVAEVAATPSEREKGLMYREEVPEGTGMLFVFQDNRIRSFWMANTYVPLDIAYIDPSYTIVDIVQMERLVTDSYPSSGPAMFALEVRQGWFADHGIVEGAKANIVFGVPAGRRAPRFVRSRRP